MTNAAILSVACLLLLAYAVDRMGHKIGVPSVVALLVIGMATKPIMGMMGVELTGLDEFVPIIGTIGLVLIVLEGAFDLHLRRDRWGLSLMALLMALAGVLGTAAVLTILGTTLMGITSIEAMLLALPISVISSAVAIPASAWMRPNQREFVVYETSISDILGILLFYAILNSDKTLGGTLTALSVNGGLSLLLGLGCALLLLFGLFELGGRIRFVPLLSGLFALYSVGKILHLSPLIMVLIFGLVLNNMHLFRRFEWIQRIQRNPDSTRMILEFKSITAELTFAVRGIFFVLLGYWSDIGNMLDWRAMLTCALVLVVIYGLRYAMLSVAHVAYRESILWMAPRGLISILLYYAAKPHVSVPAYLDGALMLVVLASALGTSMASRNQK